MASYRIAANLRGAALALGACSALSGFAQLMTDTRPVLHSAPPANPPPVIAEPSAGRLPGSARLAAPGPYSIGEPTDEEQQYVEFINRARANPQAEADRFATTTDVQVLGAYNNAPNWTVDLAVLIAQFSAIGAAPPVSINARLADAARLHSQDMFEHEYQGHNGTDGTTPADRVKAAGYVYRMTGENVYSTAKSVWYGHTGFDVDWGPGPGGMQSPPGHRNTIHNAGFREVGVGVVLGQTPKVGPQVVTQEFGVTFDETPFVTGVVYFDLNGNGFYDPGEGIGGVTVRASGTDAYAVTARSGGYSVPVANNGSYTVTFSVPGLEDVTRPVKVAGLANVKADLTPIYHPPVIGGSSVATVGADNLYGFSPVPAATSYEWQSLKLVPWEASEGAEQGLGRFVADLSTGYDPVVTDVKRAGAASFHLVMPKPARNQYLTLRDPILLGTASQLTFYSRLGAATLVQTARAQVSADEGRTWSDVWSQSGTATIGESVFTPRTISLASFAGRKVLIRFAYTLPDGGSYFFDTKTGYGLYLDEILVSDAKVLAEPVIAAAGSGSFNFRPIAEGFYLAQVRALIGDRVLSWGPGVTLIARVGAVTEPALVRIGGLVARADGGWDLGFALEKGAATTFAVEGAESVAGPWTREASAVIAATGPAGSYTAQLGASSGSARFLRVVAR